LTDRLQIDFVTETFPPEVNGVAMTLGKLVHGLQESGFAVSVFRPRQSAEEEPQVNGAFAEHLVPGMCLPMYPDLRLGFPAAGQLKAAWQNRRPDALYVATEGPLGWSAVRSARELDIPVLSGFHTNFHSYSHRYHAGFLAPLILGYLRRFHRRTRCTLAPTRTLAEQLDALDFGQVEVLPRGVDSQLFSPQRRCRALRMQWGAGDDQLVCLYVGRLAAEKNMATAVAAFRAIQQQRPDSLFVLVGGGPLHESLKRDNPDFVFCGMQRGERLARHYASGDVFLFPSQTETFGNVVTEAMASGLAVVAYNQAAAREHISTGETGVLVSGTSAAAFTDAAEQVCRDLEEVRKMGSGAAVYAESLGWPGVVQRFAALVRQQIAEDRL
jgi:glycosyltransferase involved in cell wall biosynthesis